MPQSIPESFECDGVWGFLFLWVTYTSPSLTVSLLCCIVWMDVSIPAMRLIFGEIYNLLSSVGTGCASVVSRAIWTLQHRLALLPLCPWAGSWSTSVFCDQFDSFTYLAAARPLFSQSGTRPGCSS